MTASPSGLRGRSLVVGDDALVRARGRDDAGCGSATRMPSPYTPVEATTCVMVSTDESVVA